VFQCVLQNLFFHNSSSLTRIVRFACDRAEQRCLKRLLSEVMPKRMDRVTRAISAIADKALADGALTERYTRAAWDDMDGDRTVEIDVSKGEVKVTVELVGSSKQMQKLLLFIVQSDSGDC
jgi:hypothetical protein